MEQWPRPETRPVARAAFYFSCFSFSSQFRCPSERHKATAEPLRSLLGAILIPLERRTLTFTFGKSVNSGLTLTHGIVETWRGAQRVRRPARIFTTDPTTIGSAHSRVVAFGRRVRHGLNQERTFHESNFAKRDAGCFVGRFGFRFRAAGCAIRGASRRRALLESGTADRSARR